VSVKVSVKLTKTVWLQLMRTALQLYALNLMSTKVFIPFNRLLFVYVILSY